MPTRTDTSSAITEFLSTDGGADNTESLRKMVDSSDFLNLDPTDLDDSSDDDECTAADVDSNLEISSSVSIKRDGESKVDVNSSERSSPVGSDPTDSNSSATVNNSDAVADATESSTTKSDDTPKASEDTNVTQRWRQRRRVQHWRSSTRTLPTNDEEQSNTRRRSLASRSLVLTRDPAFSTNPSWLTNAVTPERVRSAPQSPVSRGSHDSGVSPPPHGTESKTPTLESYKSEPNFAATSSSASDSAKASWSLHDMHHRKSTRSSRASIPRRHEQTNILSPYV